MKKNKNMLIRILVMIIFILICVNTIYAQVPNVPVPINTSATSNGRNMIAIIDIVLGILLVLFSILAWEKGKNKKIVISIILFAVINWCHNIVRNDISILHFLDETEEINYYNRKNIQTIMFEVFKGLTLLPSIIQSIIKFKNKKIM